MRRRFAIAAVLAATLSGTTAYAGTPGYYVTGEGGVSLVPDLPLKSPTLGTLNDSFDTGFAYGGALGYDTGRGWRFELASLYDHTPVTSTAGAAANGHLSSTSLMANATMDIMPNSAITPYVGAGLGLQNVGGNVNGLTGRAWKPAYQAEAGLRDDISDKVSLFGEYRFSQSESVTLSNGTDNAQQHFSDHALLAGLSYHLN
jgi:opacity protein-like surface antigen